jgi:hypothetical protein
MALLLKSPGLRLRKIKNEIIKARIKIKND